MSSPYSNQLPEWLKLKMEKWNWGVRDVARYMGVPPQTILDILNGVVPSLDTALGLANLFNETLESILRTAGQLPPISELDMLREKVSKETEDMSHKELGEVLSYIGMRNRLKQRTDGKGPKSNAE
jgi:transcriptional regulator with XRE-family HTH domain